MLHLPCEFALSVNPYTCEKTVSDYLHLRWCNGDVDLKSHPECDGALYPYLSDARAFICPTFKTLALHNSDDQFFQATGSTITNYKPWYNYTMNAYLGSTQSDVKDSKIRTISQVKHSATTFSFTEESSLVDTSYNQSGLNDTFMIPGSDLMVKGWFARVQHDPRRVIPGPDGVGQFYDVLAGFHNAPSGDKLGGRGNCAFLDGHVDAHPRSETFFLAWPR